jgi:hypothetical protein
MVTPLTPFTDAERRGGHRAIHERRDVRSRFVPQAVPDEVLSRASYSAVCAIQNCWLLVSAFDAEPELATRGWEPRVPLAGTLHVDRYGGVDSERAQALGRLSEPAAGGAR